MAMKFNKNQVRVNRNLDKPWRPPRLVENATGGFDYHPLDMMKFDGRMVNTTGCYGSPNYYHEHGTIIVHNKATAGRRRQPRPHKPGGKLYHGTPAMDISRVSPERLRRIRGNILTLIFIGQYTKRKFVTDEILGVLEKITKFLIERGDRKSTLEMFRQDADRTRSLRGMAENGHIGPVNVRRIMTQIRRAESLLKMNGV